MSQWELVLNGAVMPLGLSPALACPGVLEVKWCGRRQSAKVMGEKKEVKWCRRRKKKDAEHPGVGNTGTSRAPNSGSTFYAWTPQPTAMPKWFSFPL